MTGRHVALFLAEQYWPDVTRELLNAAVQRLFATSAVGEGRDRVVAILFTSVDECVFYLLDGESEATAAALVARTGRPADRIQSCERLDGHGVQVDPTSAPSLET